MASIHRPNLLWICTDQQRFDTISALGATDIETPNLDRLCERGVAFERVYCQSPICTPSRSSFLTGLYPSAIGANINGNDRLRLPEPARLVTARLADAGYRCGLAGKLHLASPWHGVEHRGDDGYHDFWHSTSPSQLPDDSNDYFRWLRERGEVERALDLSRYNDKKKSGGIYRRDVPLELHQTTWCCDRAIEFMQSRPSPWAMCVNPFDPHPPYDAPADLEQQYAEAGVAAPPYRPEDLANQQRLSSQFFQSPACPPDEGTARRRANYLAMIDIVDRNVGRLLDTLDATDAGRNTVVIFMSDHGHLLGDHGLEQKGCRFYDGLVRVPLIIAAGRDTPLATRGCRRGHRVRRPVQLVDVAPTICEIAGIDPGWSHGRSLVPDMLGDEVDAASEVAVRCEYYHTVDMGFGIEGVPPTPPTYGTMFFDGRYKLTRYHDTPLGELYDLQADPGEHDNRFDDPAFQGIVARLTARCLDQTVRSICPPTPRIGRF